MNMSADNIVLNSCQYSPVYFIENPGVSQARSYIIQQNGQNADKPASESLKRFYENSGKLESNLNTFDCGVKSRLIKKNDSNVVGNNLKLASFLLPKSEPKNEVCKPILTPVNNVVLKPVYIANNFSVNNNVSSPNQVHKLDVDSRLVKLSEFPNIVRAQNGKILPKIKPKENSHSTKPKQPMAVQAIQPVQLVKLGETYHSVNQLTSNQMKLVNHALKMLNNTQTPPSEPAYDPATNTKYIYKVVSQQDFAEKNKLNKPVVAEIKKEPVIKIEKPEIESENEEEELFFSVETKMTRSGRIVKLPKNMIIDDSPSKPKKKTTAINKCLQCNTKFASPLRLQRHYETNPSHLPIEPHTSLFHCLIAIVSSGPESERANILVQQLKELIDKLRSCVPCLLTCGDGKESASSIGDEIGKLFGISPGKYNLNTEALGCEKDKDGYCNHNPRPQIAVTDRTQVKLEKIENGVARSPSNILKVNLQEKRPTILRKTECRKQKLEESRHNENDNGKKIKLSQDIFVDKKNIEIDDLVTLLGDKTKTENNESKAKDKVVLNYLKERQQDAAPEKSEKETKPHHIQFHSAHFDIRSSPIKPTSTVFRKFQINPAKMTKYIEIIRPIQLNQLANADITDEVDNMSNMNTQNNLSHTSIITSTKSENLNYTTKNWCDDPSFMKANDFINCTNQLIKTDNVIEPALLYNNDNVKANHAIAKESVLLNVENNSKAIHNAKNEDDFLKSIIFTKESNNVKNEVVTNKDPEFFKSNIFEEPHSLAQDNNQVMDKITDQTDDFMKTDMLIEESLLNTQDCKVMGDITDRNDYMKADTLIEPALIHNKGAKDFSDQGDTFMTSAVGAYPTLHSSNGNSVMDVTQNNENDLSSNQGQSIISFLESLGTELAYSETDSRNNHIDFQLDLFSFNG